MLKLRYALLVTIIYTATIIFSFSPEQSQSSKYSVSPQTEQFIRQIQKELGLEKMRLYIFKLSDKEKRYIIRTNAYVNQDPIMVIDEEWFNELSDAEKRFLIGHELMHINKDHIFKKKFFIFSLGIPTSIAINLLIYKFQKDLNIKLKDSPQIASVAIYATLISLAPFSLWYNRHLEREADLESATTLHCARGGELLFKRVLEEINAIPHTWLHKKLLYFYEKFLGTHPTLKKRIKYLAKLAQKQEEADKQKNISTSISSSFAIA